MATYLHTSLKVLFLLPLLTLQGREIELPVSYEIPSPLTPSDEEWKVTIYQDDDLTIGRQHQVDSPNFIEQAKEGNPNWGAAYTYLTSRRTNEDLAKYQNLGRAIWDIRRAEPLQEGKWYKNESFNEIKYRVNNLSVTLNRGDEDTTHAGLPAKHYVCKVTYDYVKIDEEDDDRTEKQVTGHRDFWFVDAIPFSRVQMLPLFENNYDFVNYAEPRIQEGIYAHLRSEFEKLGMLAKTRLEYGGETIEIGVENLKTFSPPLDTSGIQAMPAIPEEQVSLAVGPLFLAEMLHGSLPDGGKASLSFPGDSSNPPLEVQAEAGFRIMDNGDFAIAATFESEDGTKGIFALLRPVHGLPEVGNYTTTTKLSRDQLKALDQTQLREFAKKFQAFALVDRGNSIKVYTQAVEGKVELTSRSESKVKGNFDLQMEALTIVGEGSNRVQRLKGDFQAVEGMKGRLRSRVGRLIE